MFHEQQSISNVILQHFQLGLRRILPRWARKALSTCMSGWGQGLIEEAIRHALSGRVVARVIVYHETVIFDRGQSCRLCPETRSIF